MEDRRSRYSRSSAGKGGEVDEWTGCVDRGGGLPPRMPASPRLSSSGTYPMEGRCAAMQDVLRRILDQCELPDPLRQEADRMLSSSDSRLHEEEFIADHSSLGKLSTRPSIGSFAPELVRSSHDAEPLQSVGPEMPNPHAGYYSLDEVEGQHGQLFANVPRGYTWDHPLSQREKSMRILQLFEDECALVAHAWAAQHQQYQEWARMRDQCEMFVQSRRLQPEETPDKLATAPLAAAVPVPSALLPPSPAASPAKAGRTDKFLATKPPRTAASASVSATEALGATCIAAAAAGSLRQQSQVRPVNVGCVATVVRSCAGLLERSALLSSCASPILLMISTLIPSCVG